MSAAIGVDLAAWLGTVALLVLTLCLSARFRLEWRIVERISQHPNSAVFPVEIEAERALNRSAVKRLVKVGVLRVNRAQALVLEVDRGARRTRRQNLTLNLMWCLTLLCATVAIFVTL